MHAWSANPFRGRTVGWLPPEIVALQAELRIVPTLYEGDMAAQARLKDVADQIVALADEWLALARGGKPTAAPTASRESF
jgi:rhamnogalacturonyl hydrolase YesR